MYSRQIVSSVGGDDEPEMRKEVGCMTGIFQLLDRHHWNKKLFTQGGHHNMEPRSSITKMKKEKTMPEGVKGKQILSDQSSKIYPSSPTPSNLSSSSSLGRYKTPQLESEFPKTPKNQHRQSPDLQDVVRESMQREARSVSVGKLHLLKRIDSPRPLKPEEDIPRAPPRFSCDGTESRERLKATTVKLKDIPRLSLDSGLRSIKRSADQDSGCHKTSPASVVAKLMGLEGFPDNSVPIINHSFFPAQKDTVFGEIEKRVSELEFKKSGKDLRALKQILEKMHNTRLECQKQDSHYGNTKVAREDSVNKGRAKLASKRNSVKEPSRYVPSIEKKNNRRTSKSVLENNHMQVRSPARLQHQKQGNNKQSSQSSRVRKQPKPGPPKTRLKLKPKQMNHAEWLGDDTTMTEFAMATTEQPSPVSVLDSAFFIEDSPSPVKKISTAFRDYELEDSNEAEWHTEDLVHHHEKLEDIQHPIYKLSISNTDHKDSINQIASLCQSDNLDHQYINKIILASGILKDLDCLLTTELHPSGNLINPELFHVLEQTEDRVRPSNGENNFYKKSHRKLIFDTVNEILVQKLDIKGSLMPKRRFLSGQQLLKEIYAEIDYLQAKPNSSLVIEDDDELVSILNADMKHESEGWEKQLCEIPELVLSIERLIFKDLVSEVIRGDVIERSRGHCRQLFTRQ